MQEKLLCKYKACTVMKFTRWRLKYKTERKKIILIGAGDRGQTYTNMAYDKNDKFEVVAVAEPIENRRKYIQEKHGLSEDYCFTSWEPILAREKFADAVIVSTMDRDHFAPTMAAIEKGYDILLEKPIAPTPEECIKIADYANEKGVNVLVCHVLRYTVFYRFLKQCLDDGLVGEVISIQHAEHVGNIHQSHSFVRGNWGNSERSSCMLLQKSCHDLDILQWLLGKECKYIQSFGSLRHFVRENAPADAPERCIDGCPHADTCYYDAVKLYLADNTKAWFRTTSTKKVDPTDADVIETLKTTNYGKCVYKCDNDVVDHQIVNMEFEDGATVNFIMEAFSKGSRNTRIMGTKGELIANMADKYLTLYDFATKDYRKFELKNAFTDETINGGHGGGDMMIMDAFYNVLCGNTTEKSVCNVSVACKNHMLAFAAEKSRKTNTVVDMQVYIRSVRDGMN